MKQKSNDGELPPLPHNLDAERATLGAIMLDNHALGVIIDRLAAEDFFLSQHVHIFGCMTEMQSKGMVIDIVTLMDELDRAGDLEAAGGASYLSTLADGLPKSIHVEHYAGIVKEKSILRDLINTTAAIQQQAFDADKTEEILERAKTMLMRLSDQKPKAGLVSIEDIVRSSYSRLETVMSGGSGVTGLPTGYHALDNEMAGLHRSELIVLAARPSQGKTSFALNIIENVAIRQREPVAMFSLEMSKESLLMRLLASCGRIDAHKFRTGHFGRDDMAKIPNVVTDIAAAPIWIDDSSVATVNEIAARAERLKREKGLKLLVVDYIQLLSGGKRSSNRQEEVSDISRGLKALAKELDVPVLVLSQLRRSNEQEKRRPQLSDLRESGAIEQDADVVLFIHRPNFYKTDLAEEERAKTEIVIAKQRNGPVGTLHFVFLARHTRFEEAVPDSWDYGLGEKA